MRSYFDHWIDSETVNQNYENLVDLVVREQLMFSSSHDLQIWLREHQPKTVVEVVNIAEAYQLAHKDSDEVSRSKPKPIMVKSGQDNTQFNRCEPHNQTEQTFLNRKSERRKCFICDSTEHLIANCPYKISKDKTNDISKDTDRRQINGSSFIYYEIEEDRHEQKIEVPLVAKNSNKESKMEHGLRLELGSVNDKCVSVLRDTGASGILVSDRVVL